MSAVKAGEAYVELGVRSQIEKGMRQAAGRMKRFGANFAAVGAAITGASTAALAAPIKLASDMEETMSKFNVVFGDNAKAMTEWSNSTAKALGVSRQEFAQMTAGMQDLFVPMGIAEKEATEMTKTVSQLAVDLGSFNNMRTADVVRDIQSAMTGGGETMKKYGVVLTAASVQQEALNMGLAESKEELTAAHKAQAALAIIMRSTTAAQGDAIRTSEGFANQVKRLWSNLTDLGTVLGQAVLPAVTRVLQVINRVAGRMFEWALANRDLVQWLGRGILIFGAAGAAITALGTAAAATGIALGGVATAIGTIGTVATAVFTPMGAMIVGITVPVLALGGAFLYAAYQTGLLGEAWEEADKVLLRVWDVAKDVFGGITDAIRANDWELAMEIAMTGLKAVVFEGLAAIKDAFIELLPSLAETLAKFGEIVGKWAVKMAMVIQNPTAAGPEMIADITGGAVSAAAGLATGLGSGLDASAAAARRDLDRLRAEAAQRAAAAAEGPGPFGNQVGPSLPQMSEAMLEKLNEISANTGVSADNSARIPVASFG